MTWVVLIALAILGYVQYRQHRELLARLEAINTDVDAITKARTELQDFIRRRVTERAADFKAGGGRERLRARLERRKQEQAEPT